MFVSCRVYGHVLTEAIGRNDVETVKAIITEHKRLTRCRIDPIHYAILKGHFQLIPILIEAGKIFGFICRV